MRIYILLTVLLFMSSVAISKEIGKTSLSGKITDKQTGEGIPGVTI
ncbi:hypothetical protein BH10BAC1_BH10BAC1_17440 [soil metagenome]